MSAIEICRTSALGRHVERWEDWAHERVAYNSVATVTARSARARRLGSGSPSVRPNSCRSPIITSSSPCRLRSARSRSRTKAAVYDLLFRTAAETLTTIAADPKHLGARVGLTAVLHTRGSALTHHPHVYVIVAGGGLPPDRSPWIACKPGFFLPVRVLSRLFRRLFLEGLAALHEAGSLAFFGDLAPLADQRAFDAALAPLRRSTWVVYAHRVAIFSSRLIAGVTSKRRFPSRSNRAELIADIRLSERQLHAGNRKRQSQQADNMPRFRR